MTTGRIAVCLHGFLRTGASMWVIARALRRAGYGAVALPTFGYHLKPLVSHAERSVKLLNAIAERHPNASLDIVTHSYGGLLARATLASSSCPEVRRVVMLSPPNRGAELAAHVRRWLPVHRLGWDPLRQLLPGGPTALPAPARSEVGVLTGGTGTRGFTPWLTEDNDGKVCVQEAKLTGSTDFLVIPVRHSLMPFSPTAIAQVLTFLEHGRFDHGVRLLSASPGDRAATHSIRFL